LLLADTTTKTTEIKHTTKAGKRERGGRRKTPRLYSCRCLFATVVPLDKAIFLEIMLDWQESIIMTKDSIQMAQSQESRP
jgi:hypothetical protein